MRQSSHRRVALATAIVMLGWVAALDTGWLVQRLPGPGPLWLRLGLLVAGLLLALAALAAPDDSPDRRGSAEALRDVVLLLLVTGIALFLRQWRLDALRVLIDEGNSIDSLFVARGDATPLLLPPSEYVTTLLHPYLQALAVDVFGPTLSGLRVSSALLGAATVPALYALGRALYDRQVALLAAFLFAVLPPHLHFSRIGLPHVMDALFGTVALAAVAHGFCSGRRRDWAIGGAALGLTHYGFEAGRLFYTPLLCGWLAVIAATAPDRLRTRRAELLALAVMFVLTILPVYAAALSSGADLLPRLRSSGLDVAAMLRSPGLSGLATHVVSAAQVYVSRPELATFYGGDTALLLPVVVPFFLLGLTVSVPGPRAVRAIVPLTLVAVWLGNAAMRDSAVYPRWVVALPMVALASALGIAAAARAVRRGGPWLAVAIALVLGAIQIHYYFAIHLDRLSAQARASKPYPDAYDAVLRAVTELPAGTDLVVLSDPVLDVNPPRSLLRLLTSGSDVMRLDALSARDFRIEQLGAVPPDRHLAVFVSVDDTTSVARLRTCLNLGEARRTTAPIAADRELILYFAAANARRPPCV